MMITSGVFVAVVVTVSVFQNDRPEQKRTQWTSAQTSPVQGQAPAAPETILPDLTDAPSVPEPQSSVNEMKAAKVPTLVSNSSAQGASATKRSKPKRELEDPMARLAMSFVGADADAEEYWLEAIFDARLPDKEREDLIEDLNEEGLSDRKRPGLEDFPLIMNRIVILEDIAPYADEFMLPHIAEAYKDLWNLAALTQGGGQPVR